MQKILFTLCVFLLISTPVKAEIFEWHSTNVQILHGEGFELTDNVQTTLTLEHANSWLYGDNFFYIDYVIDVPDDTNAEFSPRLSINKITGEDHSMGIFKDFLLAGTWEIGRDFNALLFGFGTDLDLPGFAFFQINIYSRDNTSEDGRGWQTTWAWSRPFSIGAQGFSFDGYFDYADYEEGDLNFFTQPQLLWDAGKGLNLTAPGQAWVGLEYRYWHNKFGIDGITESAPQIMAKWVF